MKGGTGGQGTAVWLYGSAATLDHATVTRSASDGVSAVNGGRLSVSDSTLSNNAGDGISLRGDSTGPVPIVSITGTRFVGNGLYGVEVANPDAAPALDANTFSGNGGFNGIYFDGGTLTRQATWSSD